MIPFKYILLLVQTSDIFSHCHQKMKDANKFGACIKLGKKENFDRWVGYSRILTCSSTGMNRHTDIDKNRISKTSMESYDNKR